MLIYTFTNYPAKVVKKLQMCKFFGLKVENLWLKGKNIKGVRRVTHS
jgi:hypothetical protein